jgi:hypothetical protein
MRSRMARLRFQCPECSLGEYEIGHLTDDAEIYCVFCFEEVGRLIRLQRWETEEGGIRPACAWPQPEAA